MSFLRAIPIGVMGMIDQGEQDDKVWIRIIFPDQESTEAAPACRLQHTVVSRLDNVVLLLQPCSI